jgi:hypothetical protein
MSVVGTEIIEQAFHSEAQMRSDFVVYSAADHEARVVVTTTEAEGAVVRRNHDKIVVSLYESNAARTIEQPIADAPAKATASTSQKVDVVSKVNIAFDARTQGPVCQL